MVIFEVPLTGPYGLAPLLDRVGCVVSDYLMIAIVIQDYIRLIGASEAYRAQWISTRDYINNDVSTTTQYAQHNKCTLAEAKMIMLSDLRVIYATVWEHFDSDFNLGSICQQLRAGGYNLCYVRHQYTGTGLTMYMEVYPDAHLRQ